jgi:hypothetical protein
MNNLKNKMDILLKEIASIKSINIKQDRKIYTEDEAYINFIGKIDEKTKIEIMVCLNNIK